MNKLTNPNEFSEFYYQKLKEKLDITDINLNRLGFVGFFIELLGNVQYDIKNYYDLLFNESFPISALDNINLLYHSGVYGYSPILAKPAEIIGNFVITPILSNSIQSSVQRRELYFDNISFIIDNVEFKLDAIYKIIFNKSTGNYYSMHSEVLYNNKYDVIPFTNSNSRIPVIGLLQYSTFSNSFTIPNYNYGSHFVYDISLNDYIYNLSIEVQLRDSEEYVLFETLQTKAFVSENKNIAFYSILPNNTLRIEFGSGIRGEYIPGANIRLSIKTTKGDRGNIGQHLISNISGSLLIKDVNINEVVINEFTQDASEYLSLEINNSVGGQNPHVDSDLQKELLQYIQTRENLVSSTDFHNNLKDYSAESEILFKKSTINENIIYLYGRILNKYLVPIYTMTITILHSEFENQVIVKSNKKYVVDPLFILNGKYFTCPFYFEYNPLFNTYDGYIHFKSIDYFPVSAPISADITSNLPIDIFINLVYNKELDITRIYIKTKTETFTKNNVEITLESQLLGITKSNNLILEEDYYYYDYSGVIKTAAEMYVSITINNIKYPSYKFANVCNVYDETHHLRLKTYLTKNTNYIINLPVIETEEYSKDPDYYIALIRNMFESINIKENRMISDDVQFRFLNTYNSRKEFNTTLLKQQYNFDVGLPFKIKIVLTFSRNDVIISKLKILDITNEVKLAVSKHLIETTTGLNLNFYKTKIIDICHNFDGVKSVAVELRDVNGIEIPNGSIESIEKESFIDAVDKQLYLEYTPMFWWFDINNIDISSILI